VTVVAEDKGAIVGHVSSLPVELRRGPTALRAGLWVDLMVHPDYRNLTLFLEMADTQRRLCVESGVELVFAFPNDRSFPVLQRMLDWQDAGDILSLEAPLSSLKRITGGAAQPVDRFTPDFDELWTRLRPDDRFCPSRGAAHLNWRYRGRPRANYPAWAAREASGRLKGFIVAKVFDGPQGRIGDILDLWFDDDSSADILLDAACDRFSRENVLTVSAWALDGTRQRAALEKAGLASSCDRTHLAGRWTAEKGPAFPSSHSGWSLFKGDSDIF
jgi:hypothetical protein